jgi:hypothetical protein
MIEILTGVFFDPSKEWYEQPQELIDLALEIEKTPWIGYELEVGIENPSHKRLKWAEWESTTEMGTFRMRVSKLYVYGIEAREHQAPKLNNQVTIIKIENDAE